MRVYLLISCFSTIILYLSAVINAQNLLQTEDQYYPDAAVDTDMQTELFDRSFKSRGIQYGGWIIPAIVDQRNSNRSLTSSITTTKLWIKSYLWDNSFIYLRGKYTLFKVISKDGYSPEDPDQVAELDVAYIKSSNTINSLNLYFGRKVFLIGTGLVLEGRGDGAEFNFYSEYINIKFFGMYTGFLHKENNPYGLSSKDYADGAKRFFTGGTLSSDVFNQTVYLLAIAQIDRGAQYTDTKERYQSQYYGMGANGLFLGNITYYAEYIHERGKSYLDGIDNEQADIKAHAVTAGMYYYLNLLLNPVLIAQYAYGSGDPNRTNYKNPRGNQDGDDTGFMNFGAYNAGNGLRPMLANLQVVRAGFSCTPFSEFTYFFIKRMTIITKYSYYMKNEKESPITLNNGISEATEEERFIGHGLDLAVRWKLFSDLSFFASYGFFKPADAYLSSESNRHFLMSGVYVSF
jgi:hypothetical protein